MTDVVRRNDAGSLLTAPESPLPRPESSSATRTAARRALLGHLHIEDAVTGVARRIRTAIGLGVLVDGEKLPKEADLARQLGVTVFSLREALGLLRDEGLIVTRVGKNGGSYVEHPPDSESMARDELERLSGAELRDLGDWRAALTTFGARLAAQRGSDETADRLAACAEEMAGSTTPGAARRALGHFHVELAAGAQSMRLTRAELVVHEEFDWLVQTLLQHERRRRAIARSMRTVADHVRVADADSAWRAGELMVSQIVTELMRERLQMIAARYAGSGPVGGHDVDDLADQLRSVLRPTVTVLETVGQEVSAAFDPSPTATSLGVAVARSVQRHLPVLDELVHGLGFMAEVGVVPQAQYWLRWWQRADDGTFDRDYSHQLDPARDDFYDYSSKSYMTQPRETGAPSAVGPYVDHGGVDDYLVTVSVPVSNRGSFVGIVAADIRVANLERALSPWLAQSEGTCVLLNSGSRVLLSNSLRHNVGDVLVADPTLALTEVGCFGWVIGHAAASDTQER